MINAEKGCVLDIYADKHLTNKWLWIYRTTHTTIYWHLNDVFESMLSQTEPSRTKLNQVEPSRARPSQKPSQTSAVYTNEKSRSWTKKKKQNHKDAAALRGRLYTYFVYTLSHDETVLSVYKCHRKADWSNNHTRHHFILPYFALVFRSENVPLASRGFSDSVKPDFSQQQFNIYLALLLII